MPHPSGGGAAAEMGSVRAVPATVNERNTAATVPISARTPCASSTIDRPVAVGAVSGTL